MLCWVMIVEESGADKCKTLATCRGLGEKREGRAQGWLFHSPLPFSRAFVGELSRERRVEGGPEGVMERWKAVRRAASSS